MPRRFAVLLLLAAVMLFGTAASAYATAVYGFVEDEYGNPIGGASVTLSETDTYGYEQSITTLDAGYFYFDVPDTPSGWTLFINPNDYNNANGTDFMAEYYGDVHVEEEGTPTPIHPAGSLGTIVLDVGTSISGNVVDDTFSPAADLDVVGQTWGDLWVVTETDVNGDYTLHGIPPYIGEVYVNFLPNYWSGDWYNGTNGTDYLDEWYDNAYISDYAFGVAPGATSVDAMLDRPVVIEGTLLDADTGMGVPYVDIRPTDPVWDWQIWTNTSTDSFGYWSLKVPPNTDMRLQWDPEWLNGYWSTSYVKSWYQSAFFGTYATVINTGVGGTFDDVLYTGTYVTGTVTATGIGLVDGVDVTVYAPGPDPYSEPELEMTGTTDGSGAFSIGPLPAGMYYVKAVPQSGSTAENYIPEWHDGVYDEWSATQIEHLWTDDTLLEFTLEEGASVSGYVYGDGGVDLPDGVWVSLQGWDGNDAWYSTDAVDSHFEFHGVLPGTYRVQFDPNGYNQAYGADYVMGWYDDPATGSIFDTFDLAAGDSLSLLDTYLMQGTSISGTVYDTDGTTPLVDAEVVAGTDGSPLIGGIAWAYTDENGDYTLHGLEPGTYYVGFRPPWDRVQDLAPELYDDVYDMGSATGVPVSLGAPATGIDATLDPGGWIEGTVTADSGATELEGVWVTIYDAATEEYVTSIMTGTGGTYRTDALPAGSYTVSFDAWEYNDFNGTELLNEWYEDTRDAAAATPVPVDAGFGTGGIDADLEVGAHWSGTVVGSDGTTGMLDVQVTLVDAEGTVWREAWTDDLGRWDIGTIEPGEYTLAFNPAAFNATNGSSYTREFWNDKSTLALADFITATYAGVESGLDAQLGAGGGGLAGHVWFEEYGVGAAGIHAWVVEDTPWGPQWVADATVGITGYYRVDGLSPGTYYLEFWDDNEVCRSVYHGGVPGVWGDSLALASPFNISGALLSIGDVTLYQPTELAATALAADGVTGLPDIAVEVWYSYGGEWYKIARDYTDTNGHVHFFGAWMGLIPGDYKVRFIDEEGTLGEAWYENGATLADGATVNCPGDLVTIEVSQQLPLPETDPPTTTLEVVPATPNGQSGWYLSQPAITLISDEPGETWYDWGGGPFEYTTTTFAPLGENTMEYWSIDALGNEETPHNTRTFKWDDTNPSAPADVAATQTGPDEATVTWTAASDSDSGIQRYILYKWNAGTSAWDLVNHTIPAATTSYVVTGLSDGLQRFKVAAVNMPGLSTEGTPAEVTIDATPPTTAYAIDPASPNGQNGWYTSQPTVTLSTGEAGTTTYYSFDAGTSYTQYSGPFPVTEPGESITFYSEDAAGNAETPGAAQQVKVDVTGPTAPGALTATSTGTTTVDLSWTAATDGASGVVEYSVRDADTDAVIATVTSTDYEVTGLTPGTTYRYYVLAKDAAGWFGGQSNEADATTLTDEPVGAIDLENSAAGVTFGRFITTYGSAFSGGSYTYAYSKAPYTGTRLDARFYGDTVRWIGPKQPGYGKANVYIDGVLQGAVDCYAAAGTLSATIFEKTGMTDGWHTITIEMRGDKNAASAGHVVVIDKFEVEGSDPKGIGPRYSETAGTYLGGWVKVSGNSTYTDNSYAYSYWAGARFIKSFTGTRVAWIGPKVYNYGRAAVYIDGAYKGTVSQYAPSTSTAFRAKVWESAVLPAGTHTIEIRPLGTKDAASSGAIVVVDGIDVTP